MASTIQMRCKIGYEIKMIYFRCKECWPHCPFGEYIIKEYENLLADMPILETELQYINDS